MSKRKTILAVAVSVALAGSQRLLANTDNVWTGAADQNYNNPNNWSLGHLPDNAQTEDALINTASGPTPLISADVPTKSIDVFVGRGSGNSAVLNQSAGTISNTGWMFIGADGANGTWNLGDVSSSGGTFSGIGQGSGTINSAGRLYVGGRQINGPGTGTLNINTTGGVTTGNDLAIGASDGSGVVNLDAGTVNVGGWLMVGSDHNGNAASGQLNMSGGSIVMPNDTRIVVGLTGSNGVWNMTGGTVTSAAEIWVGQGAGSGRQGLGIANIAGNSVINANTWIAVGRGGGFGHLTVGENAKIIKGGDATTNMNVGEGDGSVGTVDVNDNALLSLNNDMYIGVNGNAQGTVNQSGGLVRIAHNLNIQASGSGSYNLTGGKLVVNGAISNTNGGSFNFSGGTLTRDDASAPLTINGDLTPGGTGATVGLDGGKTITLTGTLHNQQGFTLDLTGRSIPSADGSVGSIALGTLGAEDGTFDPTINPIVGLTTPTGSTYISETAGESQTFAPTDRVYWLQDSGGQLSLNYSIDAAAASVPEPTAIGAVVLAGSGLLARRRRRAR